MLGSRINPSGNIFIDYAFVKSDELVLCHDDLSPCNVVFRDNNPVHIIDWDGVHPDEPVIQEGQKMVLGKFVDIQRPTFLEGLATVSQLKGTMWPKKEMAVKK